MFLGDLCAKFKAWARQDSGQLWLDDSGKFSISKVLMTLLVLALLFLIIAFTTMAVIEFYFTLRLPSWPVALAGTITALAGVISALYAANKFSPTIPFKREEE